MLFKARKRWLVVLITLLLILTSVGNAFAGNQGIDPLEAKILSYNYGLNSLTPEEKKYLGDNPELSAKRAEKDAKYLLNLMEKEMNATMGSRTGTTPPDVSILATTVPIGTDTVIYTFDVGNKGGSQSGLASYGANYSAPGKWADVSVQAYGIGSAGAWAWVGPQVYISGTGSRTANVVFYGSYAGSLFSGLSSTTTGKVRVSIWDYTLGAEINGSVVWEGTASNWQTINAAGPITAVVQCTLQAGHTYAFRFGVSTSTTAYGLTNTYSDFWNNGSGPEGVDGNRVLVDFI
jgi:hypothetical protein